MTNKTEKTPEEWAGIVESKIGPLSDEDRELIQSIAKNIVSRWKAMAVTEETLKSLHEKHETRAQAWIVAIVEMVRAVGDGEPERFKA